MFSIRYRLQFDVLKKPFVGSKQGHIIGDYIFSCGLLLFRFAFAYTETAFVFSCPRCDDCCTCAPCRKKGIVDMCVKAVSLKLVH